MLARAAYGRPMVAPAQELLRALAAGEDGAGWRVLALRPEVPGADAAFDAALTPKVRMLVQLAALVAIDAPTATLRWAVELASSVGADEDEIVGVLATVGREVGLPRIVEAAPRLALAIGYEVDVEGWDGT
jgi:4-carboxymuconolactone decarboxylase